jgi:hypothetical protein
MSNWNLRSSISWGFKFIYKFLNICKVSEKLTTPKSSLSAIL